jgi:Protein of unknown function (DUF3306)
MFKHSKTAALVAMIMFGATGVVQAEDNKMDQVKAAEQVDRTMTFAIPRHAMQAFVETLGKDTDFSVFVDKECPVELHQMALRKLWKQLPEAKNDSPWS